MLYGQAGVPSPAARAVEDLSSLLRYSLERGDQVPFRSEIEATERYLSIHRLRYGDGLGVSWRIAEGAGDCLVPKLILQPLVENSLQHAFGSNSERRNLSIESAFSDDGRSLRIRVEDDGEGMTEERLAEARSSLSSDVPPSEHIGLQNTNRRIRLLYGGDYGISISPILPRGTQVEILLPVRLQADSRKTSGLSEVLRLSGRNRMFCDQNRNSSSLSVQENRAYTGAVSAIQGGYV
jgi:two-component system sensor histidine kinase YesM